MSKFLAHRATQGRISDPDRSQAQRDLQYAQVEGSYRPHGEAQSVADEEAPPPAASDADGEENGELDSVPAGFDGRPGLERASAATATETRSVGTTSGSEGGDVVQIVRPEDDQPLRRLVMRSASFSKEDFEELLAHHGQFHVATAVDPRIAKSHLPPNKLEPPVATESRRGSRHRCREFSILRLPMLRPDYTFVMLWSIVVLFSDLTYSAFIVPVSIGMWTSFYTANWTTVCDYFFGAIFFSDIIISLHVGFIAHWNTRKLLVMNGRLVARHYLTSFGFMVDFLSSIAWITQIVMIILYNSIDSFDPNTALVVMEGIRLLRFLRVVRLLYQLVSNGMMVTLALDSSYFKWMRNQTVLSGFYLLYLIAVVVNFLGCLWNFTAGAEDWENSWVNFYEPFIRRYGSQPDAAQLTQEEAMEVNRAWLWLVGDYWALSTVATVGFGDVVPSNATEVVIAMMVEVVGVMFFGLVISSISELLQQANRKARRVNTFQNKLHSVEHFMSGLALPSRLQHRIKTFYAEVWIRQHEQKEETLLFQELPHSLRNEVAWQACRRKFRHIPLLQELDEQTLYRLASKLTPFRFAPGHDLATEGDPADRYWLLAEGEVVALYHYQEAERLEGPCLVGEAALLQDHEEALQTYPCTYRTLTSCSCWMLRHRDFFPMLKPALRTVVKARALQTLASRVKQYPAAWSGKLKRLHSLPEMPDSATDGTLLSTGHGHQQRSRGVGDGQEGSNDVAALVSSSSATQGRLARASAPAATSAHQQLPLRSVSWRDEQPEPAPQPAEAAAAVRGGTDAGGGADCSGRGDQEQQEQQQNQEQRQQHLGGPSVAWAHAASQPLAGSQAQQRGAAASRLCHWQAADDALEDAVVAAGAASTAASSTAHPPAEVAGSVAADSCDLGAGSHAAPQAAVLQQQAEQHELRPRPEAAQGAALQGVLAMAGRGMEAAGQGLATGAAATLAGAAGLPGLLGRMVVTSPGAAAERGEWSDDDDDAAAQPVVKSEEGVLPRHQAIAILDWAMQQQQDEEAAIAAAPLASGGGSGAQAEQMLGAVLAELQSLRQDLEAVRRRCTRFDGSAA